MVTPKIGNFFGGLVGPTLNVILNVKSIVLQRVLLILTLITIVTASLSESVKIKIDSNPSRNIKTAWSASGSAKDNTILEVIPDLGNHPKARLKER
jgi:hypothetical protein